MLLAYYARNVQSNMQNIIFSKGVSAELKSITSHNASLSFLCHFTDAIFFSSFRPKRQALLLIGNNAMLKIWKHNSYVPDSCGIQSQVGQCLLSSEK